MLSKNQKVLVRPQMAIKIYNKTRFESEENIKEVNRPTSFNLIEWVLESNAY